MKVLNVNGAPESACNCENSLEHWKRYSGQVLSSYCAVKICLKPPEAGAQVQKEGPGDKPWFIVPVCGDHNALTGKALEIGDRIALAPADTGATCGARALAASA